MGPLFSKTGRWYMLIALCIALGIFVVFSIFMLIVTKINNVKCTTDLPYISVYVCRYKYRFTFLETNGYMNIDENRVEHLYKHVFPPALSPGLSFVGLPSMVSLKQYLGVPSSSLTWFLSLSFFYQGIQFVMFEIQSKWVAAVLSRRVTLPTEDKMMEDISAWYASLDAVGIPKRYTHKLGKIQVSTLYSEYDYMPISK